MQATPMIIGLGKTGLSFAQYLARKNCAFSIMDSRENPPGLREFRQCFPHAPIHLGGFNRELILNASELLMSPGIDPHDPIFAGTQVIGDIEIFAREAKAPIIGITGTNAKGTVTTLVGEMLRNSHLHVCVGGNIGTPALELLMQDIPDFYVLEISSFQLETTQHLPTIAATLLNLSPDHLDRHHTMENYHAAKQRIYRDCESAIVNRDDAYSKPLYPCKKLITFGLDVPEPEQFGIINDHLAFGSERLLATSELRMHGKHNWANALAALAIGKALHLPLDAMLNTLREFPGLEHRCEWVAAQNNVQWINDSKGTNIGATIAALEGLGSTLQGKIILIAGGLGKDADFNLLQTEVSKYVREIILIGRDAPLLNLALKDYTRIQFAATLSHAVTLAGNAAHAGDAVLLSPACASWDMFKDFEDRGRQFKSLVRDFVIDDSKH